MTKPIKGICRPSHPGAILRELVLPGAGLSAGEFADALGVPRHRRG